MSRSSPSGALRRRVADLPAVAVVALVVALVAMGCSSSGGGARRAPASSTTGPSRARGASGPSGTPVRSIAWHDCDGGQCGTLQVPRDYAHPDAGLVELALFRSRARNRGHRLGSLLVNPGGPGASGVDLARALPGQLPTELRDRFDIVGWDPRGTGASTSVDCGDRLDYLFAPDASPDTAGEEQAVENASKRFADACEHGSGALLPFVSSAATAQDMDRIRAALGDDRLTFLGYSYGTYLGALYANAFPGHVRAFVLDGAVDPVLSARALAIQQAQGFEHALADFFNDCAQDRGCPFHSGGDPKRAYEALDSRIEHTPLVVHDGAHTRELGPTQFELGVTDALYGGKPAWPVLASALWRASRGDGGDLLDFFDETVHRGSNGRYANEYPAFLAIGCLDGPSLGDLATVRKIEAEARVAAPHFGASNVTLGLPCEFWPVPPVRGAGPIAAPGAPPILVVGTTGDPATPVAWARGLARELGSGRLLVYRGEGHTAFPADEACLDDAVVHYLVDLRVPADGTTCG